MAKMDRLVTVKTQNFETRTWAERIDRPSGEVDQSGQLPAVRWDRVYRIRYFPEIANAVANNVTVVDENDVEWRTERIIEEYDRNRYIRLECYRSQF